MGGSAQFRKKPQEKSGDNKQSQKKKGVIEENYTPIDTDFFSMDRNLYYTKHIYDSRKYPQEVHPEVRETATQSMSLMLGNNAKPTIVSTEELQELKREDGAIVLSRSANSFNSLNDFFVNDYTIQPAGRWGGSLYGEGIYFDYRDGQTAYGTKTITGVLSKKAKLITSDQIYDMHDKGEYTAADGTKVSGNFRKYNDGALALALGYDAISISNDYDDYFVLLNRSALITDGRVY